LVALTVNAHGDFSPKLTRAPLSRRAMDVRGEQWAAVMITRGWINVAVQLPRNMADGPSHTPTAVPPTISLTSPAWGSLGALSSASAG